MAAFLIAELWGKTEIKSVYCGQPRFILIVKV